MNSAQCGEERWFSKWGCKDVKINRTLGYSCFSCDRLQLVSISRAEHVRPCRLFFLSFPHVGRQGRCLAVDADAAIDSSLTAASRSPSPAQCSSWQRLQVLPFLTCTKPPSPARLCIIVLVTLFRKILCCDLVRLLQFMCVLFGCC